ncbi:hypothetical protein [Streptomyces sp. CC224B]|uniref:hypothetical protein n=1 Tax=Streptomyces sp. CC224B TaxID=3044571 RepID=UPI0024A7DE49|nr:hypothetical protein [Streptomyces sp. CC224B]
MAVETGTQETERVAGRVWTVRLDPHGRLAAGAVRLSCSRPACADQHFPDGAAAARKAAIAHVNAHLARVREEGGPRGDAWCACRAVDCAWHSPGSGGARPPAGRCGGPVVLTVYADRAGRLWRVAETCARCAAATADCRVLDTAPPPSRGGHAAADRAARKPEEQAAPGNGAAGGMAALFSDCGASPTGTVPAPAGAPARVPQARAVSSASPARRPKRRGKIAQRLVPDDLEPEALRRELTELGDAFRAYQKRPEPDLALLAALHERKARAFALWADVSGDDTLREEAERAEKAAETTREMHENRTGQPADAPDGVPVVERLLTRTQAAHARAVLDHVAAHTPCPGPEARLAVLMLTLRAARAGTGNVTGQDLSGWLHKDAERVLEQLVEADWLRLPDDVADALDSRPEDPTLITVPALLPDRPRPFGFGKTTRARLSGWAQKVVGDRKIRKKKGGPATRLIALYTAAHTGFDGRLGHADDGGLDLDRVAAFCALPPDRVTEQVELLLAADWFAEAEISAGRLCGRLSERVLPLGGLL